MTLKLTYAQCVNQRAAMWPSPTRGLVRPFQLVEARRSPGRFLHSQFQRNGEMTSNAETSKEERFSIKFLKQPNSGISLKG